MKPFKQIREKKEDDKSSVYIKKKFMGSKYTAVIHKSPKGFVAYLDGDKLDTFRTQKDAMKGLEMAMKELT